MLSALLVADFGRPRIGWPGEQRDLSDVAAEQNKRHGIIGAPESHSYYTPQYLSPLVYYYLRLLCFSSAEEGIECSALEPNAGAQPHESPAIPS